MVSFCASFGGSPSVAVRLILRGLAPRMRTPQRRREILKEKIGRGIRDRFHRPSIIYARNRDGINTRRAHAVFSNPLLGQVRTLCRRREVRRKWSSTAEPTLFPLERVEMIGGRFAK